MTAPERKRLAERMRAMREQGVTVRDIAARFGCARHRVYRLLQLCLPPPPVTERAGWSRPDAELLRIAHAIRREIEAAEGFKRPMA